jgi:hypothetical protein
MASSVWFSSAAEETGADGTPTLTSASDALSPDAKVLSPSTTMASSVWFSSAAEETGADGTPTLTSASDALSLDAIVLLPSTSIPSSISSSSAAEVTAADGLQILASAISKTIRAHTGRGLNVEGLNAEINDLICVHNPEEFEKAVHTAMEGNKAHIEALKAKIKELVFEDRNTSDRVNELTDRLKKRGGLTNFGNKSCYLNTMLQVGRYSCLN